MLAARTVVVGRQRCVRRRTATRRGRRRLSAPPTILPGASNLAHFCTAARGRKSQLVQTEPARKTESRCCHFSCVSIQVHRRICCDIGRQMRRLSVSTVSFHRPRTENPMMPSNSIVRSGKHLPAVAIIAVVLPTIAGIALAAQDKYSGRIRMASHSPTSGDTKAGSLSPSANSRPAEGDGRQSHDDRRLPSWGSRQRKIFPRRLEDREGRIQVQRRVRKHPLT